MKFISLFAGIGGFDLALIRQGHECVWANEWDKYAAQIYDKNFNQNPQSLSEVKKDQEGWNRTLNQDGSNSLLLRHSEPTGNRIDTRDIRTVPKEEIPDHDILVGGFPCQAFSIAGKRRGFDDTRGTLFFEIARILRAKKPRLFILENVKGLLSHDNGNTFKTIISTLDELGYDIQWQVLNSKNFGVPQNRERVFIIGHLRGTPRPEVFPIRNSSQGITKGFKQTTANTLTAGGHSGGHHSSMTLVQLNQPTHSNNRLYGEEGISPTLNTAQGGNRQPKIAHTVRTGGRGSGINTKQNWDSYEFNGKIRRLTPIECERLQGFPDNWTAGVSDTQRYKMCGNAVTVNVVDYLLSYIK